MELHNEKTDLERMKAIFEEREREYQEREAEFKQRRDEFHTLEEHLRIEKAEIEEREKHLHEQEDTLKESLLELQNNQERLKADAEQLKKEQEAFEAERNRSYLQAKLAEEELKNERIKVKRQSEQLEYQREMGNLGIQVVKSDVNMEAYILRTEVAEKYVLKEEVRNDYVLKTLYEEETEKLREENKALQKAKTDLFRKMFGKETSTDENVPNFGTEDKQAEESEEEEYPSTVDEKLRDMTADDLKNELLERTDFRTPKIRHSEGGELVETEKGRFSVVFVFAEVPYFDIVMKEKESKRRNARLTKLVENHSGVTYDSLEDGSVRINGYFVRTISTDALLAEVENIMDELA